MRIAQNWKGKNPRRRRRAIEVNKGHRIEECEPIKNKRPPVAETTK